MTEGKIITYSSNEFEFTPPVASTIGTVAVEPCKDAVVLEAIEVAMLCDTLEKGGLYADVDAKRAVVVAIQGKLSF